MLINLWADKVDAPMHVLHMAYGIGWTISPMLTLPFLSHPVDIPGFENATGNNSVPHDAHLDIPHTGDSNFMSLNDIALTPNSHIAIPFFIVGGMLCALGGAYMYSHFRGRPGNLELTAKPRSTLREVVNPGSCAAGDRVFGITMTGMFAFFYTLHVAQQLSVTRFLFTYVVDTIHLFTEAEATWLMMVNGLFFTFGRGIMAVASHLVPIVTLVFFELGVMMVSSIALAAGPTRSKTNIWISSCLFNCMSGPLWPAGFTWASKSLILYTFVIALIDMGNQAGGLFFQWLAGYLLEYCADKSIMYFTVCTSAMILLLAIAIHVFTIYRRKNYTVIEDDRKQRDGDNNELIDKEDI